MHLVREVVVNRSSTIRKPSTKNVVGSLSLRTNSKNYSIQSCSVEEKQAKRIYIFICMYIYIFIHVPLEER